MIVRLLLSVALAGCTPSQPLADNDAAAEPLAANTEARVDGDENRAAASGDCVANLPFSHGNTFCTLDEYLAHLERYAGPIDQPWWREIRPGVYEHVKRMPGAPRETATRAELMQRFGFSR